MPDASAASAPRDPKAAVREYFDRDADGYLAAYTREAPAGDSRRDVFLERRDLVLSLLHNRVTRVLDVGAGPGVFTPQLLGRGARCSVMDLSFAMMAAARRQVSVSAPALFLVGDVDVLPFRNGAFDTAICVGVLQYLPSLDRVFAELARVVEPGGYLVVTFPNAESPLNRLHQVAIVAARRLRQSGERVGLCSPPDPTRLTFRADVPNRFFASRTIVEAAERAGFRLDRAVYHILQFPFSVPGLRFVLSTWNQAVRGRIPRDRFARWGREGVMRLVRVT